MSRITNAFLFAAIVALSSVFIPSIMLGAEVDPRLVVPDAAARTAAMKVAQEAFAPDMRAARSPLAAASFGHYFS